MRLRSHWRRRLPLTLPLNRDGFGPCEHDVGGGSTRVCWGDAVRLNLWGPWTDRSTCRMWCHTGLVAGMTARPPCPAGTALSTPLARSRSTDKWRGHGRSVNASTNCSHDRHDDRQRDGGSPGADAQIVPRTVVRNRQGVTRDGRVLYRRVAEPPNVARRRSVGDSSRRAGEERSSGAPRNGTLGRCPRPVFARIRGQSSASSAPSRSGRVRLHREGADEGSGRTSRHPGRRVPVRSFCDGPDVHSARYRAGRNGDDAVIIGGVAATRDR